MAAHTRIEIRGADGYRFDEDRRVEITGQHLTFTDRAGQRQAASASLAASCYKRLQTTIDAFHRAAPGPVDETEYLGFQHEIGYSRAATPSPSCTTPAGP